MEVQETRTSKRYVLGFKNIYHDQPHQDPQADEQLCNVKPIAVFLLRFPVFVSQTTFLQSGCSISEIQLKLMQTALCRQW